MRSATPCLTSVATGTGWYGEPFQQVPAMLPGSPQVASRWLIRAGRSPTARATRPTSTARWGSASLSRRLRSIEITQEVRFATSGRPMSSTISPRCGWTTISRTDCEAAWAWYSSPPTTWR